MPASNQAYSWRSSAKEEIIFTAGSKNFTGSGEPSEDDKENSQWNIYQLLAVCTAAVFHTVLDRGGRDAVTETTANS